MNRYIREEFYDEPALLRRVLSEGRREARRERAVVLAAGFAWLRKKAEIGRAHV